MMLIPHLVAALLAVRQSPFLPSTYCSPECPSCKTEVSNFDSSISCLPNSTFIANCGTCQQCIITYAIEEGATADTAILEKDMTTILSFCENSTAADQIVALESQASKLSVIGVMLSSASVVGQSKTASMVITAGPTATATDTDVGSSQTDTDGDADDKSLATPTPSSNSTLLSTIIPVATDIIPSYPSVASATTTPIPTPKLSSVWIAGPVAGSILGMATVFVVIFFTRRRQRRADTAVPFSKGKDFDTDSNRTSRQTNATPDLRITVPPVEVANQEIHELPALEPVGTEMHTPRDKNVGDGEEGGDWPLPLSPLPLLFAMSELRDQRREVEEGKKHETFYHA